MVIPCHINLLLFSLILLTKSLLCQPVIDNDRKVQYQEINESDLRSLIANCLSHHPLGILGHIIVEAIDKAGSEAPIPDIYSSINLFLCFELFEIKS